VIRLVDITKTYPTLHGGLPVLKGVDLHVRAGEFAAILGPSGSGKSTLLHVLGMIHEPTSGQVWIDGHDTTRLSDDERSRLRGRLLGFVFQSFHLIDRLTIVENAALPLFYQGLPPAERRARAEDCLRRVGLGHRLGHYPSQLSGGESQRTAIARALAADPRVILADEPTGNLDHKTGREILQLLRDLHAQGRTIVVITHDEKMAAEMPRRIRIADGCIVDDQGDGSFG
jgi:putative ABC transport system ATP-binding protein